MTETVTGEWLIASETRAVIAALTAAGATPRFVGGCVRDAVLNKTVRDIDIAVDIMPDKIMDALSTAGLRAIPTGIDHGTVTAMSGKRPYEITTLRRDIDTDGRHAKVEFTSDWKADASRRDFTMNALYADPDGTLIDILGSGLSDLAARRVRFIGSANDRINEDFLRILRLFRFHAWYGKGEMEPDALVACAGLAGGISGLSKERVGSEMLKLMSAPRPDIAIDMMVQTGVMAQVLPMASGAVPIGALISAESRIGISADPMRRLAFLTAEADPVLVGRALRLSNEQMKALKMRAPLDYIIDDAATARRAGYQRGEASARDILLMQAAHDARLPETRLIPVIIEGSKTAMPVRAADLMGIGIEPGPRIGEMLSHIETRWIESDFTLDKATLLDDVKRVA